MRRLLKVSLIAAMLFLLFHLSKILFSVVAISLLAAKTRLLAKIGEWWFRRRTTRSVKVAHASVIPPYLEQVQYEGRLYAVPGLSSVIVAVGNFTVRAVKAYKLVLSKPGQAVDISAVVGRASEAMNVNAWIMMGFKDFAERHELYLLVEKRKNAIRIGAENIGVLLYELDRVCIAITASIVAACAGVSIEEVNPLGVMGGMLGYFKA